ncbi:MAG: hypothetical protein RIT31_721 [Actinomycetota bacterium]|jgi:hypothetical protein
MKSISIEIDEPKLLGLIEDLRAYDESIRDASPNIPWDEVKRDLGLS